MSVNEKQFTKIAVPEGFWRDAKGRLIPIDMVKEIDRARDTLVGDIINRALPINVSLKLFKNWGFEEVDAFRALSAEQYDANIGGEKGNITLYSFDGEYRVQVAIQDRIAFDERLQTAKTLIDECIKDWSVGSRPEILAIIEEAFKVDKEGNINTGDILKLRRLNITDEKWLQAMDAISESVQVVNSCRYIRIYQRSGDNNQYTQISLNITGV
ncbi:DUF3164 family protein [Providencia rettgeri]|uniref:DUF3164 family protein n=1 Tax=Providencia rettgeri TaxID=587 RepID=A0AAP2K3C0_PRORE|nr:DUF3164 family protein [Providencia rettgeri]MBX6950845.1 DUF3164 family protein [Providencia rettgeri]MBX6956863.1 DUF3164 family protein [Providencia rettgeri]MBX6960637.1 DUF3164 family protein [Providencia rettgeri]MBX6970508.1 DUF3164 family protein [Providencia rettgeri]MBX6982883.1 DUF3164 family protein [Providencia rettgeri]